MVPPDRVLVHMCFPAHLGRESQRGIVNPELSDLVDELEPLELPQVLTPGTTWMAFGGAQVVSPITLFRIDDEHGRLAGVVSQA